MSTSLNPNDALKDLCENSLCAPIVIPSPEDTAINNTVNRENFEEIEIPNKFRNSL